MKKLLSALSTIVLMSACATVKVSHTEVASGATNPSAIYIRPFDVSATQWKGYHPGTHGQDPIRQSLAGKEFADDLKYELDKLAPSRVLKAGEEAPEGWLVEGALDVVDAGQPVLRALVPFNHLGLGRSKVVVHVRVTEVGAPALNSDKDAGVVGKRGRVIYEFDMDGGSRGTGELGSLTAPGLGYSVPFDFKNAAERVSYALSIDPLRLGDRTSATIR